MNKIELYLNHDFRISEIGVKYGFLSVKLRFFSIKTQFLSSKRCINRIIWH